VKIANPIARLGEDKACEYLKKLGFKILERNYRKTYGEIDVIALEKDPSTSSGQVLAFIEVKTRTSNQFGSPLEAITYFKLKSLIKTAEFYKMTHKNLPESLRIDAVSVILNGDRVESIDLMRNISGF
jgi:putative endonuclease